MNEFDEQPDDLPLGPPYSDGMPGATPAGGTVDQAIDEFARRTSGEPANWNVILLKGRSSGLVRRIEVLRVVLRVGFFKAASLALRTQIYGESTVWSGCYEVAELKRDQLAGRCDAYGRPTIDHALDVELRRC